MPTKMPRVTFAISAEELSKVEAYQRENNIKNQSQAFISLIRMGFNDIEKEATELQSVQGTVEMSPVEHLASFVENLTEEQACFMVELVEYLLRMNPKVYPAARELNRKLWKG